MSNRVLELIAGLVVQLGYGTTLVPARAAQPSRLPARSMDYAVPRRARCFHEKRQDCGIRRDLRWR